MQSSWWKWQQRDQRRMLVQFGPINRWKWFARIESTFSLFTKCIWFDIRNSFSLFRSAVIASCIRCDSLPAFVTINETNQIRRVSWVRVEWETKNQSHSTQKQNKQTNHCILRRWQQTKWFAFLDAKFEIEQTAKCWSKSIGFHCHSPSKSIALPNCIWLP